MPRPTSPKPSSATQSAEPQNDVAMPRAIIFDLDDTLVDQAGAARRAVVGWAAEHGITGVGVADRWETVSDVHYRRYQSREIGFQEQRRARAREGRQQPVPRRTRSHRGGLDATLLDRHDAHPEAAVRRISTLRDLSW